MGRKKRNIGAPLPFRALVKEFWETFMHEDSNNPEMVSVDFPNQLAVSFMKKVKAAIIEDIEKGNGKKHLSVTYKGSPKLKNILPGSQMYLREAYFPGVPGLLFVARPMSFYLYCQIGTVIWRDNSDTVTHVKEEDKPFDKLIVEDIVPDIEDKDEPTYSRPFLI